MEMADGGEELVLQWPGHAAHVTERFSGLLARQALVDVTLICQGQKLRVHKLVLASSSLYFEEILEQDLGQEPIILLRDLDFEVLKAMVEFMYCGETTISQCHLQRLLEAARVFKVKELKCIVESMMKSGMEKILPSSEDYSSLIDTTSIDRPSYKEHPSEVIVCEEEKNSPSEFAKDEMVKNDGDRTVDSDSRVTYIDDDNSLYEIGGKNEDELSCRSEMGESLSSDNSSLKISTSDDEEDDKNESPENDETSLATEENPLNSSYNETRCCKFIDDTELRENHNSRAVGECSRVYAHKKRKFVDDGRTELTEEVSKFGDYSNDEESHEKRDENCGKGLKVYTHKRRKSMDERRSKFFDKICDSTMETSSNNTSSIDLSEDKTSSDTRIFSSLDMETSEYVWSLNAENLQGVVGGGISSSKVAKMKDEFSTTEAAGESESTEETSRRMKRLFSRVKEEMTETPVLRRSVRINQLESDDSFNNNNATLPKEDEKSLVLERNNYADNDVGINPTRSRRRSNKHKNYRITDENNLDDSSSNGKTLSSRSLRSRAKFSSRKSTSASSRDERRKNTRRNRDEKTSKIVSSEILVNTRLNTIASVDRALWGDMSDVMENHEDSMENTTIKCSTSREIPFAVGLLPLRAALERMQATLDHQPRKTRSSVTPWRQETVIQRRRFNNDNNEHSASIRKQMNFDNMETAVCHIEIRTSSSARNDIVERPVVSTDEKIVAVGESAKIDEQ